MISPWVTIVSPKNRNIAFNYLDKASLERYGRQKWAEASPESSLAYLIVWMNTIHDFYAVA